MHTDLQEGQTLPPVVWIQPAQVEVVESAAQRRKLRLLTQDLHHAAGYEPTVPFNIAIIPVIVHSPAQAHHVAGCHGKLSRYIALIVVQGFS